MIQLLLAGCVAAGTAAQGWDGVAEAGAATAMTRGERTEHWRGRLVIAGPIASFVRGFLRGDLGRTQDGGDLADASTFRSIEVAIGARARVGGPLSVGLLAGVTYSAEGRVGAPSDARLYSYLGLFCLDVAGGYVCGTGGHRGPVGGPAVGAAISIPKGKVSTTVDFDLPLRTAHDRRTWQLTIGASAEVFKRRF